MRRKLAALLVLCLVCSLLPTSVFAADTEENSVMPLTTVDDHNSPVVTGVYMNSPGGTVTVGDTLYFSVSAEDESGINMNLSSLWFTFVCEQGHEHTVWSYGYWDAYNEDTKQANFELTITDDMLNGTYTLSRVVIRDIYDNIASYYPSGADYPDSPGNPGNINFDTVRFTVTGSSAAEDHNPPVVTTVSMEDPGKPVTTGDTLYFTVSAEDESGINMNLSSLWFTFVCEQGHEHTVWSYGYWNAYNEDTKQANFELTITDDMLNGTYTLSRVVIRDIYDNIASYYPSGVDYPDDPGNPGSINFNAVYFVIATPDILPEKVSIPEKIEVDVRSVYTIRPDVEPIESIPDWKWTSADTSIATVASAGGGVSCNVTGVAPGTTTITGVTQNELAVSCVVTVTDAPLPESGTIDATYQVNVGSYVDIVPVLTPANATTLYEVFSDNPHVAGIDTTGGYTGVRISGNNPGTATITIRGANNLVMTTTVRVGKETDIQHEKRTIEGYPATCGWPGWTDRVVCSACWYVFTEGQNIPATGEHTWGEWQVVQAATSAAAGSKERYCEACGTRETEVIPATGSTSSGSGGSSSSDDSSSPDRSGNVTSDGQNIQATVKSGSAEITNSDKNISSILDGAENGTVHIDASSYKDVTEVSIPKGVVDAISNSETVSSVSITTSAGTVELHEEALKTLADAMTGSNDIVSFEIKTIDVNTIPSTQKYPIAGVLNSAVFVNLSASIQHKDATGRTTSTEVIHEFGGSVTVSVPYELPANMEGQQIIACHIADDGTITYFPVTYENGVATFTTTHFSIFAVMESRAAAFGDIDISAWYMLGVEYILYSGLMSGYGNDLFAPNDNLSRAMLTQILYNKEGNPAMSSGDTFADISANDWYSNAVIWAAEKGIVGGYDDGLFGPNDNITREQFAAILWRYAGSPAAADQELHFTDVDMSSGYALEALRWATENGILNGYGDGQLNPRGSATRAQAAQMLKQYLSKQF